MSARSFTIDELITRGSQLTDTENDSHLGSAEKFSIMNSAIAETWDKICDAGLNEQYITSKSFNTVPNTLEYDLQATASNGNYYRTDSVYIDEGNGHLRPLQRVQPAEIRFFRAPVSAVAIKHYYTPYSPILTTGQSFDGINGWEEHTLQCYCIAVKEKKEDSAAPYLQRKAELEHRIARMGNIDWNDPPRVARKRKTNKLSGTLYPYMSTLYPYTSNVNAYGLRGGNMELYYAYPYVS